MRVLPRQRLAFFIAFDALLVAVVLSAFVFHTSLRFNTMHITSIAFEDGSMIPPEYTCDGPGATPVLAWSGVPSGAKSLALVVDDPDAAIGLFTHWMVWDLPPAATGLPDGKPPSGAMQGTNSGRSQGWFPPCPQFGTHRYVFTLIALDQRIGLPVTADRAAFDAAIAGHELGRATLVGRYVRTK